MSSTKTNPQTTRLTRGAFRSSLRPTTLGVFYSGGVCGFLQGRTGDFGGVWAGSGTRRPRVERTPTPAPSRVNGKPRKRACGKLT